MMVGRPLEEIFPRGVRPRGAAALTATNVTTERLPRSASLTLYEGRNSRPGGDGWRGPDRSGARVVRRG